ncbi:MAG: hypothetical protein WAN22_35485 [Solirubrobacteraceae bacterium]
MRAITVTPGAPGRERLAELDEPERDDGVPPSAGGPLEVIDLYPLPPSDPERLVSFYVTLSATILAS